MAPPLTAESVASDSPSISGTVEGSPVESIAGTNRIGIPAPFAGDSVAAASLTHAVGIVRGEHGMGFRRRRRARRRGTLGVGMDRLTEMMGGMGVGAGE